MAFYVLCATLELLHLSVAAARPRRKSGQHNQQRAEAELHERELILETLAEAIANIPETDDSPDYIPPQIKRLTIDDVVPDDE